MHIYKCTWICSSLHFTQMQAEINALREVVEAAKGLVAKIIDKKAIAYHQAD